MLEILKQMKQIINFKSMYIIFKFFLIKELMYFEKKIRVSILSTRIFFVFLIFSYKEIHKIHITLSNKIMIVETITILYFDFLESSIFFTSVIFHTKLFNR